MIYFKNVTELYDISKIKWLMLITIHSVQEDKYQKLPHDLVYLTL